MSTNEQYEERDTKRGGEMTWLYTVSACEREANEPNGRKCVGRIVV